MKFSIKDFFSKCERTPQQLQICSYLLKKSLLDFFSKYEQICYLVKLTDQIFNQMTKSSNFQFFAVTRSVQNTE